MYAKSAKMIRFQFDNDYVIRHYLYLNQKKKENSGFY